MRHLDTLFTQSDRDAINRAVQAAEARTSAEILPVVVASSGRYDRSEDIVGLWLGVAALLGVWCVFPSVTDPPGSWGAPAAVWQFLAFAAAVVVGFMVGALIGSRVDVIRHLFTPARQLRDEVNLRARAVFYDERVHHTAGRSGVLLYVSLFERMAVVLADESVVAQLGQTQIDALCAEFTQRLRTGAPTTAFCETIALAGERLSSVLPRQTDDVNELADALVVLR